MADLRDVIPTSENREYYDGYVKEACLNPQHRDAHASMLVWPHRFRCLACGFWGTSWNGQAGDKSEKEQRRSALVDHPAMPFEVAMAYHASLGDAKKEYFTRRGLTDATIRRFLLGYGCPEGFDHPRFTIPVVEGSKLLNIKFRADPEVEDEAGNKYMGVSGHNRNHLWGVSEVHRHPSVLVTGGEIDRIHAHQDLFPDLFPITTTGGEGSYWPDEWIDALRPVEKLYVCLDSDKPGRREQEKLCRRLRDAGLFPIPVHLPEDMKDADIFLRVHGPSAFKALLPSREKVWFMARATGVYWQSP